MNGKLDRSGCLEIERAGELMPQYCPIQRDLQCGDWCPHFSEPRFDKLFKSTTVRICQDCLLWFDEFTDERGT